MPPPAEHRHARRSPPHTPIKRHPPIPHRVLSCNKQASRLHLATGSVASSGGSRRPIRLVGRIDEASPASTRDADPARPTCNDTIVSTRDALPDLRWRLVRPTLRIPVVIPLDSCYRVAGGVFRGVLLLGIMFRCVQSDSRLHDHCSGIGRPVAAGLNRQACGDQQDSCRLQSREVSVICWRCCVVVLASRCSRSAAP